MSRAAAVDRLGQVGQGVAGQAGRAGGAGQGGQVGVQAGRAGRGCGPNGQGGRLGGKAGQERSGSTGALHLVNSTDQVPLPPRVLPGVQDHRCAPQYATRHTWFWSS